MRQTQGDHGLEFHMIVQDSDEHWKERILFFGFSVIQAHFPKLPCETAGSSGTTLCHLGAGGGGIRGNGLGSKCQHLARVSAKGLPGLPFLSGNHQNMQRNPLVFEKKDG